VNDYSDPNREKNGAENPENIYRSDVRDIDTVCEIPSFWGFKKLGEIGKQVWEKEYIHPFWQNSEPSMFTIM